jgi:phage shock protein A
VLTKPDKGSQAALIAELQETTAEQERELERQEKRLKNYTLEILELKNRIKALEHQLDTTKWEVVQQVVAERVEKAVDKSNVQGIKEITPEVLEEAIREANKIRTTIRN